MAIGNANNGRGWDHVCTADEDHGLWEPQTNRNTERCWVYVGNADGTKSFRCKGKLKVVGAGSRKLAAEERVAA